MAVVERKSAKGRTTFWIAFYDATGKQRWERSGTDKRAAEALDRKRKKEVEAGTYAKGLRPTMPFGEFLKDWMSKRTNRNAEDDRPLIERFLLTREWLCRLPCEEFRPRHSAQLIAELKVTPNKRTGRPISEKYVSNLYGLYCTACRDAQIAELMPFDPCVLPRGTLRRKSKKGARTTYELEDVVALLSCPNDKAMVFAMLALLTGMREGEVCGRRWRDWDPHSMPLGCLSITSQYNDQPLKTDKDEPGEYARKAPVHPVLAKILEWWQRDGFEFTYCRKPTRDDFIVPRTNDGKPHTRSSAYKLWRKACSLSGVTNRSLHSTRHTFLSLPRRKGARGEVLEQITHNATGNMVDHYTHWDWAPLCEAVLCLVLPVDSNLDRPSEVAFLPGRGGGGAGNRSVGRLDSLAAFSGISDSETGGPEPPLLRGIPEPAAFRCAGQGPRTSAHTETSDPDHGVVDIFPGGDRPAALNVVVAAHALLRLRAAAQLQGEGR